MRKRTVSWRRLVLAVAPMTGGLSELAGGLSARRTVVISPEEYKFEGKTYLLEC